MAFVQREAHAASGGARRGARRVPGLWDERARGSGRAPRRNATVTTIAPTGTLASSPAAPRGIEPLFALAYVRRRSTVPELREEHPLVAEASGPRGRRRRCRRSRDGTRARDPGVPDSVGRVFATAHDVSPDAHVRMQAAFQRHVDNGVSKTINLPTTRRWTTWPARTGSRTSSAARGSPSTATARERAPQPPAPRRASPPSPVAASCADAGLRKPNSPPPPRAGRLTRERVPVPREWSGGACDL